MDGLAPHPDELAALCGWAGSRGTAGYGVWAESGIKGHPAASGATRGVVEYRRSAAIHAPQSLTRKYARPSAQRAAEIAIKSLKAVWKVPGAAVRV